MSIWTRLVNPIVKRISAEVTNEINKSKTVEGELVKSKEIQGLSLDPNKLFYRIAEKGLRKPSTLTFETLRRMSKAVHIARLAINHLKHKVSQTEWDIVPADDSVKPNEHHVAVLRQFFNSPNRQETFRTFLDGFLEDLLALDAACFEKVENNAGLPAEIWYVDGSTVKPNYDIKGILQDPAYYQYVSTNSNTSDTRPDAEWSRDDLVYVMQNPQRDVKNYGYGLSPLEGIIMVATNLLNADNYMGQFFDVGTLPPKLINLGKDITQNEVEFFRSYWKSEVEGHPWKTGFFGGGDIQQIDLSNGRPADMQFEQYQIWLMKIVCAAFEISPQDIGFTAEMKIGGLGSGMAETQKSISDSRGYRSLLQLTREVFNREIVLKWFGFEDVKFDWVGIDSLDPQTAAEIFAIESKAGAVSINEYRVQKGLKPIMGGVKPQIITTQGVIEIDATPLEGIESEEIEDEKEDDETRGIEKIEKKIFTENFICWMDDRGFGQPFIWVDKFGHVGYVIKPPVAVNINGLNIEQEWTHKMAEAGLNVLPVDIIPAIDIDKYLPSPELRQQFKKYQNLAPEYYSKKWESKYGHSRKYEKYTVMAYIEGRILTDQLLLDDMKRVPGEYEQAIRDLVSLWKFEKANGMGDRRANQYIITPDKRAYGFDYQFVGSPRAWEKYEFSIAKTLEEIPRLKHLFMHETGLETEAIKPVKKSTDKEMKDNKTFNIDEARELLQSLNPDWKDKYSIDEFLIGMNEELEHSNITGGDPIMTAKIVLAHLNEHIDYYTRLNSVMQKSKKKIQKGYYKQRSIDEMNNFWKAVMIEPEKELASHLESQSKRLKPNIARIIRDTAKAKKSIAADSVLSEAADKAPRNNLGLQYTKSIDSFYKNAFELGVENFNKKVAKKLKKKGISPKMIDDVVGKSKVKKTIERSGIYSKLKERGTNMIKTVAANKQERLLNYIENEADKGRPMREVSVDALEKFSLPLEEYEVQRIAKTETAWAANQGALNAGEELGIEKFEVLLDPDACEECQDAYGGADAFSKDELDGVGEPPLHPNCQCSVEPFINESNIDEIAQGIAEQYNDLQ